MLIVFVKSPLPRAVAIGRRNGKSLFRIERSILGFVSPQVL
jgi:hypothetical protein